MPLAPWQAALIGIVALALGWIVYDLLCKSPIAKSDALLALVGFGYVVATSYVFTLVFSGRGALIHTGALMATMMTANVFFIIMPNQRKSIAALIAGETPDPEMGQGGQAALDAQQLHHAARAVHDAVEPLSRDLRQRACHPGAGHLVIIAGALVRYFYNMWHGESRHGAVVGVVRRGASRSGRRSGSAWPLRPACAPRSASGRRRRENGAGRSAASAPAEVVEVVSTRCVDVPCARAGVRGHRRGAQGRAARYARAYRRVRAGDPHAGGA